jgi:FkbM family methyltransferase
MSGFAERVKLIAYKWWYSHSTKLVVQAHYMNSKVLVRPNEDVGLQILTGTFEKNDLIYLLSKLKEGDLFIDVGANIGLFSIVVAKANATVRVHAFEPIPINVHLFKASLCLNKIESVKVNESCVGDYVGEVEFSLSVDSAYSSIHDTGRLPEVKKFKAKITTLSDYVTNNCIKRVDVLKIDVEGAEKLVLDGARNIFVDHSMQPRLILMELFDQNFKQFKTSITEIVQLLGGYGYKPFVIEDGRKEEFMPLHHNFVYNVFFELGESA